MECAAGYPGTPNSGCPITLPADTDDAWVLQAGTKLVDGGLVSSGGRVLGTVARGADLDAARATAYAHLAGIDFADGFHRTDIGIPH